MSNRIIITGATGLIGKELAKALFEKGYDICVFGRNPESSKKILPFAKEHVKWQVDRIEDWRTYIDNSKAVINLAGANLAEKRWSESYKKELINSRVNGTSVLAKAIIESLAPPEVLISASASGYYGNSMDAIMDESKVPVGTTFLSDLCLKWENATKPAESHTRLVFSRTGVVLSETGGALEKMLTPYMFFIGGPLGSGQQWMPWIHISDLIAMFIWVVENPQIHGAVNFVAPQPVQMKEFSRIIAKVLHRPSLFRVPEFLLKIMLGESHVIVTQGNRLLPKAAQEQGFSFKYEDLETSLENLLTRK
ncbi:MAG: TIGR01777 family oxidoreductase [Bacteroidota bacterium]